MHTIVLVYLFIRPHTYASYNVSQSLSKPKPKTVRVLIVAVTVTRTHGHIPDQDPNSEQPSPRIPTEHKLIVSRPHSYSFAENDFQAVDIDHCLDRC